LAGRLSKTAQPSLKKAFTSRLMSFLPSLSAVS
jgi:hypothetical protein